MSLNGCTDLDVYGASFALLNVSEY